MSALVPDVIWAGFIASNAGRVRWRARLHSVAILAGLAARFKNLHWRSPERASTHGRTAMNLILWLAIGGAIGWLASVVMKRPEGFLMNIVVGVIGASFGGWLTSALAGAGTINQNDFSLPGRAVSWVGAVIVLAIVNLFMRGRRRT